jgi:sirohydrochlorin cobaltochelatase
MTMNLEDQAAFKDLEDRLWTVLPELYQDCYEDVQPVSMGSASLKYGDDGKVAWNEIWATFCDLAMAGGPPHKGKLLEPGSREEIDAQTDRYCQVVEEICRGVSMVTGLANKPSPTPGWVRVECSEQGRAGWLVRAIVMENISARSEGTTLDLPAGPSYRIEKEIKNVVTAIAKTCHYWTEHMGPVQKQAIAKLFAEMAVESPLIQPELSGPRFRADTHQMLRDKMAETIHQLTGLRLSDHQYTGWLGVECPDVGAAIWMMRAMAVSNVLSRREGTVLFVPVNPTSDPNGETVIRSIAQIRGFYRARHNP